MKTYTVQAGDSLSKIARDVLGDITLWPEIARLNDIKNTDMIYPGQILKLPEIAQVQKSKTGNSKLLIGAGIAVVGLAIALAASKTSTKTKRKRK